MSDERKIKEVGEPRESEHILKCLPPGHWPEELDVDLRDLRKESAAVVATSEAAAVDQPRGEDERTHDGGQKGSYPFDNFLDDFSPRLDDELGDASDISYDDSELEPTESIATTPADFNEHAIPMILGGGPLKNKRYLAYVTDEADEDSLWVTDSHDQPNAEEQVVDIDNPDLQETHDDAAPVPEQDELAEHDPRGLCNHISEPSNVVQKPAYKITFTGKPKGIFHRVTFSSKLPHKRALCIKHTSTSALLGYKSCFRGSRICLAGIARKHVVSMKCYALCGMARALLGKKSKFQRRLSIATMMLSTETLLAKNSCTPLAREIAWQNASEEASTAMEDVGDDGWESDC